MSTLKLKTKPSAMPSVIKPTRNAKVIEFTTAEKPKTRQSHKRRLESIRPSFQELFGAEKSTTGQDLQVLRAYMHQNGLPEINERLSFRAFATIFSRFVLPRRDWKLFGAMDYQQARVFLAEWSGKLLPVVQEQHKIKKAPHLHRDMIPEIAALYNPAYFGLEVQS